MSSITDIKSVLTQKGLDIFCQTFHKPDDVHLQLPSPNQIIHEMPTGKIGVYTRFFEYVNFRLPLSTFLVNVLRYYHISLSQLSIIAAAKVSHFEILCRVYGIESTVGLFRCFYVNSKNKGWMSFSKHPDVDAVDPFPKSTEFKADDYAILVAHPAPFRKFSEPFLCLIGMSRNYTLDEDTYPTFLHDDETEMDLFAFIHVADPPKETETGIVVGVRIVAKENVVIEKPKRPRKKRKAVTNTGGSSHPPKKLRGDYGTSDAAATSDKSPSVLKELLASSMLNVEADVAAVATLPMVTSSVSASPKHESGVPADSITRLNLRTIGASKRFVISLDSSHHSSKNASGAKANSVIRSVVVPPVVTEAVTISRAVNAPSVPKSSTKVSTMVHASMFHDSDSTKTVKADTAGPSYSARQDLSLGSRELNSETLHQVFVSQWNVLNDSLLDDHDVSHEFVDHLAPPALFSQIREMDYHHLFIEFNVGTARQACLNAEVRMRTEYCLSERKRLESECEKQDGLLKVREGEIKNLKAQLSLKEVEAAEAIRLRAEASNFEAAEKSLQDETDALKERNAILEKERNALDVKVTDLEASAVGKERKLTDLNSLITSGRSQNDNLMDQVHELETTCSGLQEKVTVYENCMEQLEKFQDDRMKVVNDKFDKLYTDFVEMALHLEEKFYPHLLTTISGRRWLLSHGMELAIVNFLNSAEVLTNVAAHNPSAEVDYIFALQQLQNVNFSLLLKLKSNKDASVETVMDILCLEGPLAKKLGLNELQPYKIRENIANHVSVLRDVFVPLVEPLSAAALTSTEGTSDIASAAANTTTALSTTFASTSTVPPITIEDYEIIGTDGPENAQGSGHGEVASFPNTIEFEKDELDTTPERDPAS
ncbi:hypothetical protein Tco_0183919 [Tanacetum coccineum]